MRGKIVIVVTRRVDDYLACLQEKPERWEAGGSQNEAIAKLVNSCQEELGIKIEFAQAKAQTIRSISTH